MRKPKICQYKNKKIHKFNKTNNKKAPNGAFWKISFFPNEIIVDRLAAVNKYVLTGAKSVRNGEEI